MINLTSYDPKIFPSRSDCFRSVLNHLKKYSNEIYILRCSLYLGVGIFYQTQRSQSLASIYRTLKLQRETNILQYLSFLSAIDPTHPFR